MARRKKAKYATSRKVVYMKAKTKSKKKTNKLFDLDIKDNLMSGVYGGVRGIINNVNPLNKMFGGAGKYADELAMFVGLQAVKTFSSGEIRRLAKLGQNFECALVGHELSKNFNIGGNSNNGFNYFG